MGVTKLIRRQLRRQRQQLLANNFLILEICSRNKAPSLLLSNVCHLPRPTSVLNCNYHGNYYDRPTYNHDAFQLRRTMRLLKILSLHSIVGFHNNCCECKCFRQDLRCQMLSRKMDMTIHMSPDSLACSLKNNLGCSSSVDWDCTRGCS